ncbi:hypothetical protein GCM10009635_17800 [Actinocatenispora thailandica]
MDGVGGVGESRLRFAMPSVSESTVVSGGRLGWLLGVAVFGGSAGTGDWFPGNPVGVAPAGVGVRAVVPEPGAGERGVGELAAG